MNPNLHLSKTIEIVVFLMYTSPGNLSFQACGRFSVNSRRLSQLRADTHPRKEATQKGVCSMSTEDNKALVRRRSINGAQY